MPFSFKRVRTRLFVLILLAEIPALLLTFSSGLSYRSLFFLLLFSVLAVAASWYGGTLFVERWIHPLLVMAQKLSAGDRTARTGLVHDSGELGALAKAIDDMAESLEQLPRQTELILDSAGNGVISLDVEGRVTYANPSAAKMLGFELHELKGQSLHSLTHHKRLTGEPFPESDCPIHAVVKNNAAHLVGDDIFWRKDGRHIPVEYAITSLRQQDQAAGAVVVFSDLSEKVRMKELDHMSYHDALTGLPNRRLFEDRLHQVVLNSQRQHQPFVLLVFDLNGFKNVNDSFGHQCGDLLLRLLSFRLAKAVRESDTIARIGGDEFALILPSSNLEGAKGVIGELLRCFDEPLNVGGHSIKLTVSIGVAVGGGGVDAETLERKADEAMYRAKRSNQVFEVSPDRRHNS